MPAKRSAKALKGQVLPPAKAVKSKKNRDAVAAAENRKQETGRAATLAVITMLG
jgi:hypothetical protein